MILTTLRFSNALGEEGFMPVENGIADRG